MRCVCLSLSRNVGLPPLPQPPTPPFSSPTVLLATNSPLPSPLREELGLSTCSSAGASWCDLGVSVGVGGGIGLLGVLTICGGVGLVCRINSQGESHTATGLIFITLGVVWCLSWASGVLIWGGEDGATYVGIMWGVPIVMAVASRCLAVYRVRTKDEQDLPVSSAGRAAKRATVVVPPRR